MRFIWSIFLVAVLAAGGCGNDDGDISPEPKVISGYTLTDEWGAILAEDPDDWVACGSEKSDKGPPPFPIVLEVLPAFPNETNGICQIEFHLPKAVEANLSIWREGSGKSQISNPFENLTLVRQMVDSLLPAGSHLVTWDGKDTSGKHVGPGLFRCVFESGECVSTGDIKIVDCPYGLERLLSSEMLAYLDEHWSLEKLEAAFDFGYLGRPDANPDFASVVGIGFDYFPDFDPNVGLDALPMYIDRDVDLSTFLENVAMWNQFVFGWDDFRDPQEFIDPGYWDVNSIADPRTSIHREVYRGVN